jgi:hypothetical protein
MIPSDCGEGCWVPRSLHSGQQMRWPPVGMTGFCMCEDRAKGFTQRTQRKDGTERDEETD